MLLKELLDNISSETVLRDKEVEQSWLNFKDAFHQQKRVLAH